MLSKENRVKTQFFSKTRKSIFSYNLPSLSIKVYRNKQKLGVGVVIPKGNVRNSVQRNTLRRKIFGVIEKYKKHLKPYIYIIYPKKDFNFEEIKKDLEELVKKHFLDNRQDVV